MNYQEAQNELLKTLTACYDDAESKAIARMVWERLKGTSTTTRGQVLTKEQGEQLDAYKKALATGKPVQQVLEEAWFYGLSFYINEHVLVPRPETEQLAQMMVMHFKHLPPQRFLDVGTGSGCIPIAIAHHLKKGSFWGIDISSNALNVASINGKKHHSKVQWMQHDFLSDTCWPLLPDVNVLVSNPPYIPRHEEHTLADNVKLYEPHLALFVSDDDPLIFYRNIAAYAKRYMNKGGMIFLEIHASLAADTFGLMKQHFDHTELMKDWYGQDRFLVVHL